MNENQIPNFEDFVFLNESASTSKKNLGIIGPLANWSLKLQVYPEPNQGMIGYSIDENWVEISHEQKKIKFPKSCCDLKKGNKSAVIHIKPYTKWFSKFENREEVEEFVDSFINSHNQKKDEFQSIKENSQIILDSLGIHTEIEKITKRFDDLYEMKFQNGMEAEIVKPEKKDLFTDLKIYKSSLNKFPDIRIKKKNAVYTGEFRGPAGKFNESENSLVEILENQICNYLTKCVLEKNCEREESNLLKKLGGLISEQANLKDEKQKESKKEEIERLQQILTNTMDQDRMDRFFRGGE